MATWNASAAEAAALSGSRRRTVIVGFRGEKITAADSLVLASLRSDFRYRFGTMPAVTVELPEAVIPHLRAHPRIEYVAIGGHSPAPMQESSWGLATHRADYAQNLGYSGNGYVIAVIGSGVNCNAAQVTCLPGKSFIAGESATQDFDGHETAIASIAATNAGGSYRGIAPQAKILPIKVVNAAGVYHPDGCNKTAEAIDWAVQNGAHVINFSYGQAWNTPNYMVDCQAEGGAIVAAMFENVVIVASAGNRTNPFLGDSVVWPARWNYSNILAVGALTNAEVCDIGPIICSNPVRWASFSSFGSQVDIAAAGHDVKALDRFGAIDEVSGTSFAAPHVAAAVVILRQKWPNVLDYPPRMRTHIWHTARPPDPPFAYVPNQVGGGVLDILNALNTDPCSYQECPIKPGG